MLLFLMIGCAPCFAVCAAGFSPFLAGKHLHVDNGVFLVHNFEAQHCFYHVFHGYDTAHTAVFVNDGRESVSKLSISKAAHLTTQKVCLFSVCYLRLRSFVEEAQNISIHVPRCFKLASMRVPDALSYG